MREVERTNQFRRDFRLAQKRGKKLERLEPIIAMLAKDDLCQRVTDRTG